MPNYFDQFDTDEEVKQSPDPLVSRNNFFDQFDEGEDEDNFFDQFDDETTGIIPEPEAPGEEQDPIGLWDQFVGGFYDERARANILSAVNTAQEIQRGREAVETGEALDPPMMGSAFAGITEQVRTLPAAEGREEYLEQRESQLLENLQEHIDTAMDYKARGEEIPFSPETQQFLDENSENGILEDFWAAPFTIIAELGVRSAVPSLKGAAVGTATGLAAGAVAGPAGATAGFAGGMGAMSAREEYAASIMQGLQENGVDLSNAEAIVAAMADEQLVEEIQSKAGTRAAIIGGVDSITGGLAGKAIPAPVKSTLAKEMINLAGQTGIQVLGGGGGEALAQYVTEGEVAWREVAAEAAGELVTAPVDVAAAVAAGVRGQPETDVDESALAEIERIQREAEEQAAAAGGDALDQAIAGAEAAANARNQFVNVLDRAAQLSEEELAAAEQADETARAEIQEEAAAAYEAEVVARERATTAPTADEVFEAAEEEAAAQKEAEIEEAQYQREIEAGEQIEAVREPEEARPTLADVMPEEVKKAAKEPAKKPRKPAVKPAEPALIEDKTPDVVVNKRGEAMTRAEIDAERQRLQVDAAAGEIPLRPSDLTMERRFGDLRIAVETPEGNVRSGRKPDGTRWDTTMRGVDYGFIRGSAGADADQIDTFVSTRADAQFDRVWVIDQIDQQSGEFDEHKVMIGFRNQADAVRGYLKHYEKGWKSGPVTEMSAEQLQTWAKEGVRTEAVSPDLRAIPATEEDLAAVQERAVSKGRGRPKILYKLPEGYQVQTTEESLPSDPDAAELTLELVDDQGAVRGGITADVIPDQRQIKIAISKVDEGLQGRGIGLEMYNHLLQEANTRGFELVSDISVSAAAARVYQAMERRGATVIRNPAARLNERGDWVSDDVRNPVFRVMPTDIRLRAKDLAGQMGERALDEAEIDTIEAVMEAGHRFMAEHPELKGTIVETPGDLPDRYYEELKARGNLDARGFFDIETGDIFIIAANNLTVDEVIRTALHEGVTHKGMRIVLGEKLPGLLDDVWENGDQAAITKIAERYGYDVENAAQRRMATEEHIAELSEKAPNAPILRRVIDAIRAFLREAGLLQQWTDDDIHALLRDVRRDLKGRPLNEIDITSTAEVEETGEVVEIARQADIVLRQHDKRVSVVQALRECL